MATLRSDGHSSSAKRSSSLAGILSRSPSSSIRCSRGVADLARRTSRSRRARRGGPAVAALDADHTVPAGTHEQHRLQAILLLAVDL